MGGDGALCGKPECLRGHRFAVGLAALEASSPSQRPCCEQVRRVELILMQVFQERGCLE